MELKEYKLGDLLDVTRGTTLSGEFYSTEGEFIRLTLGHFDYVNGGFKENISKDNIYFTGTVRDEFILNEGDLITPLTEQTFGLIGSTALIPESGKYIQSQDVGLIKCNKELLLPEFCYYLLPTKLVKDQLSAGAQQTSIRHTSPDKIKACKVFIPGIEEQRRIANLLSAIDNKINVNRAINQNLEAMAKQLYDYWFVQFYFPNEVGQPYKLSGGIMKYNAMANRQIPQDWEVVRLKDRCETYLGGTPSTEKQEYWGGMYPWLNSGEVAEFPIVASEKTITKDGLDNSATCFLKAGSVTLSITRHLRPSIVAIDACINQSVVGIAENELFKHSYIYPLIAWDIPRLMKLRTGAQQPHISKEVVENIPLVVPPTDVLKKYYEHVVAIYESIINNAKQILELQKQRDELLPLLMNGQVSVKQLNSDLSAR